MYICQEGTHARGMPTSYESFVQLLNVLLGIVSLSHRTYVRCGRGTLRRIIYIYSIIIASFRPKSCRQDNETYNNQKETNRIILWMPAVQFFVYTSTTCSSLVRPVRPSHHLYHLELRFVTFLAMNSGDKSQTGNESQR
jgi:hypothetical protein